MSKTEAVKSKGLDSWLEVGANAATIVSAIAAFSFNLHLILDIKPPYGGFFVLIPSIILFIVYYTACGYSPEGSSLAR